MNIKPKIYINFFLDEISSFEEIETSETEYIFFHEIFEAETLLHLQSSNECERVESLQHLRYQERFRFFFSCMRKKNNSS